MHNIFHSFSTFGLVLLTFFSGGVHHADVHVSPTPVVLEANNHNHTDTITATGSVSRFGQTVTFTFTFPEHGGSLQGSLGGACSGTIQGSYSQKNLTGTVSASCPILITTFTGTATFTGHVTSDKKSTVLHTQVVASGLTDTVDIPVTLSE